MLRMPRRAALPGAALTIVLGARAARTQGTVNNLMPGFWSAYDAASGPPEARARAIIQSYFQPNAAHYVAAGIGRVDLVQWLSLFDPIAPEVRRLSDGFPALWADHTARFARAVPDFDPAAPVRIFVSFFWFDARVRAVDGRVGLSIGLDGVVRFHGANADLGILLAHECFHLYQFQVNPGLILPGGDPLWLGFWLEGLAILASARVHPGATRLQVMLGDAELAGQDRALLRRVATEALPLLDQTAASVRGRFLGYGYRGDIPARTAYAAGYAIAEAEGANRTLAELARMPAAEARAAVMRGLERLAGP